MPRVPPREQTVDYAPVPGVRVSGVPSAGALGVDLGNTLQKVGSQLYDIEREKQDSAAILDAETRAGADQLEILKQLQSFKGKDAAQSEDYAKEAFEKSYASIREGLRPGRQQRLFDQRMQPRREAIQRQALNHFNTENEKFLEQTYQANMEQSVNFARANADYPMQVSFEKDVQEMKIRERGARLGYDPDLIAQQITAAHSVTNREVISALLAKGDDLKAKAYYDKIVTMEKGADTEAGQGRLQFTAKDRDVVERSLEEGSTRGAAHRAYRDIMAGMATQSAEERRIALNTADVMDNEKVGALVRQKLEHAFAQEDQRKREEHDATFANSTKLIDEQWKQQPTKTARELIPAEQWADLSVQDRHNLDTYLAHLRDPGKKVTDLKTWVNFNSLKDEELAKLDKSGMMKILNRLSESDQDKALIRWNGVLNKKEGKATDVKFEKLLTNSQYLDNALENSGHFPMDKPKKDWTDQDKQLWNDIQNEAGRALSELPEGSKPKEVQDRVQAIVDKHLKQKFKYDKGFFSFEKEIPAGLVGRAMEKGGTLRVPLTDIPQDQQDQIRGMILDDPRKASITTEKIEQIYAIKKRIDLSKAEKKQLIQQLIGQ